MALLESFDALYRATSINAATFTDGDPWPNEGTAGSAYNALSGIANPGTSAHPHFVTSPSPGFEITAVNVAYYYVPDGAGIEPGTGSFTAFGKFYWPAGAGGFDNVFAKIQTPPAIGSGGKGWQVASGSALGNATYGIAAGGGSAFQVTDPKAAIQAGNLSSGEHLVVLRLDRDADRLDLFIDGVKATGIAISSVADVTAAHEWIFGRGKDQTNRAYGYIGEALNDYQVQLLLPYELGEDVSLFPTLSVETSLTTDPLDTPSWEDQTDYVTSVQYRRGRDQALAGQFQPGTATVRFDNPDRRFDPNHAAGPHYGDLVPGKRMRIQAEWLGETYDLFGGFVDGWPQEYQFPFAASSDVPLSDGLTLLNRSELGSSPFQSFLESLNPVHWWKLDEPAESSTAHDSGSVGLEAAVMGAAQAGLGADGLDATSQATSLDNAVDGYVSIAGADTTAATRAFLLQMPTTLSTEQIVMHDDEWTVMVGHATSSGPGEVLAGDTVGSARSGARVDDDEPHLVVIVRDAPGSFTIYIDGADSTVTPGGISHFDATTAVIGILGDNPFSPWQREFRHRLQHVAWFAQELTAGDALALSQSSIAGFDADTSGERIERLLDLAAWPTADRDIDAGEVTLEGVTDAEWNGSVLDTARIVEESEAGALYQQPDYTMRFRGRYDHLTATRSTTSQYTFSDEDTAGVYHYESVVFPEQSTYLYNRVKVSWLGGEEVVTDTDSIAAYGPREHSVTTILPTAAQARSLGEWLISQYSEPVLRVDSITLNPAADARLWVPCLDLREGDRVTVRKHPQEVGDPIEAELIVEGISGSIGDGIGDGTYTITFSSADTKAYWIWGTSYWQTLPVGLLEPPNSRTRWA